MIKKNILLKDFSNYKIGGPAAYFLEITSEEELVNGLKEWENMNLAGLQPPFVLAAGTNILIDDKGYSGLIIHNKISGISKNENIVIVGGGVLLSNLLDFCIENSLSGFEWAGGLPGTIGGAVRGNAGAFGQEIKDSVIQVKSLNFNTLEGSIKKNSDCEFSYRNSFFKTEKGRDEVITQITLQLSNGNQNDIENKINEKIEFRIARHPMEYPSIGSTFKNVPFAKLPDNLKEEFKDSIKNDPMPIIPVVKILTLAGLKGTVIGEAQISEKHANFIINLGRASSNDVRSLIKLAKEKVFEKFGIKIEEEIIYLGGEK